MESSFKRCWFIIIFSFLFAKDYYISFSFSALDYQLNINQFICVKAMTQNYENKKMLFKIPTKFNNIDTFCKNQKDEIVLKLLKSGIYTSSYDDIFNNQAIKTYSKITFIPKRFDIIIKNGFAYFYLKGD